jgi:hypothetical protein
MTPAMIPLNGVAPLAMAMPKHKGRATKKTTRPDGKSDFKCLAVIILDLYKLVV